MLLAKVTLVFALGNAVVSLVMAIKNGKGWWSAFLGWSVAVTAQAQIVLAG